MIIYDYIEIYFYYFSLFISFIMFLLTGICVKSSFFSLSSNLFLYQPVFLPLLSLSLFLSLKIKLNLKYLKN